ncbi:phosphatase domain-containing putative toxin [Legionella fallonii]|nr:hypothetical protein [Legionella fallonii]
MKINEPSTKIQLPKGAFWTKNHWQDSNGLAEIEPVHWRSTGDAAKMLRLQHMKINRYGMDTLFISGSAAPSLGSMIWLKKQIGSKHPVVLIDLRQETHLYLNNLPISLFYKRDEINWGKSPKEINESEQKWTHYLTQSGIVQINKLGKPQEGIKVPIDPVTIAVKEIDSEQKTAQKANTGYFRIEVPDYHPPAPDQVDQFLIIIKNLPANAWLHFHCAAGNGRTTTFMVMRDILSNSQHLSLEDIITRQAALGGINLFGESPSLTAQPWKKEYHQARTSFIKLFYTYVHSRAHLNQSFSSWIIKQPNSPYKQLLNTSAYYHQTIFSAK